MMLFNQDYMKTYHNQWVEENQNRVIQKTYSLLQKMYEYDKYIRYQYVLTQLGIWIHKKSNCKYYLEGFNTAFYIVQRIAYIDNTVIFEPLGYRRELAWLDYVEYSKNNIYHSDPQFVHSGNCHKHHYVSTEAPLEALNILSSTPLVYKSQIKAMDSHNYPNMIEIDELYNNSSIYFKWKIDERGRMYPDGNEINPIGEDFQKSSILNIEPERLTKSGERWLKIAIANESGYDKKSWFARMQWFSKNQKTSFADVDPENPYMFKKLVREYEEYDERIGFSSLIGFDMCWSGGSIMGALTHCKSTLHQTGVTSEDRQDFYTNLMDGLDIPYSRKEVKKAIMPFFYMSKMSIKRLGEYADPVKKKAVNLAPGAFLFMKLVDRMWDKEKLKELDTCSFTIMGKKRVECSMVQSYEYSWNFQFRDPRTDTIQSINNYYKWKVVKHDPDWRGLAANIIHAYDAWFSYTLVERFNQATDGDTIVPNHDKWFVHPNNVDILMRLSKEIMIELFESNDLINLCKQFGISYEEIGDCTSEDLIMNYMLS